MNYITTADFSWPETTPAPMFADVEHYQTPEDIIGPNKAGLFKRHFGRALNLARSPEIFEKEMQKKFNESDRAFMAETYTFLRKYGWWPDRFDSVGRLVFEAGFVQNRVAYRKINEKPTEKDISALADMFESPKFAAQIKNKLASMGY